MYSIKFNSKMFAAQYNNIYMKKKAISKILLFLKNFIDYVIFFIILILIWYIIN